MVMANLSSAFNLTLLNLFIGLCRGVYGLPSDFKNNGYIDKWVEFKFSNSENQIVQPEIILSSDKIEHSLLFEWKSGYNIDPDQLQRYSKITAQDLQQRAFLSRRSSSRHDVVIIGKEENIERIILGVRKSGCDFPVLSVSDRGLSLKDNHFNCTELTRIFNPDFIINMDVIPTSFIPFDRDSELWIVAEKAMPKILEYMSERKPRILLDEFAKDIVPAWVIMDNNFKKDLKNKIYNILDKASNNEFREFLKYNLLMKRKTGTPTWEIIYNPLDLQFDKRQAAYRRLHKLQEDFIEALRKGERQRELPFPG